MDFMRRTLVGICAILYLAQAHSSQIGGFPEFPPSNEMSPAESFVAGKAVAQTRTDEFANGRPVTAFGAKGDCSTDDWWAFQRGIEAMAAMPDGGALLVPSPPAGACYRISQALRMRSNVAVVVADPSTTIRCTGNPGASYGGGLDPTGADTSKLGKWPFYSCVLFGSYESNNFALLKLDAIGATHIGENVLKFKKAGMAAFYAIGDVVSVETATNYAITGDKFRYIVPTWRQISVVTMVSTSANSITIRDKLQASHNSTQVLRLTNGANKSAWPTALNAVGEDTRVPMWASTNASIIGGTWNAGFALPFSSGSGAYAPRVHVHSVIGLRGIGYGNAFANGQFSADEETISGVIIELSEGSHDNVVEIGTANASAAIGTGSSKFPRYIGVNESARNNSISVGTLHVGSTRGGDVVQVWNATSNKIRIRRIDGESVYGSTVEIAPWPFTGGTPPGAENNVVQIGDSWLASQKRYVSVTGATATGNHIEGGRFHGAIIDTNGYGFALISIGAGNSVSNISGSAGSEYCSEATGHLGGCASVWGR